MATKLVNINGIYYLPSDLVKIFPSAYRGVKVYGQDNYNINLESKLSTENSLRHLPSAQSKGAYRISWNGQKSETGLLCCVINGYYFELNITEADITIDNTIYNKLCIYLDKTPLAKIDASNLDYTTRLMSWHTIINADDSTEIADTSLDFYNTSDQTYYFTGLRFVPASYEITSTKDIYYLDLTKEVVNNISIDYTRVESAAKTIIGKNQEHIAGSLYDGAGDNAIRANDRNNAASGDNAFAIGTGTSAIGNNQFVFGKYNTEDSNKLEIVGKGEDSSHKSNARTLDTNGNEWLASSLNIGTTTNNSTDKVIASLLATKDSFNAGQVVPVLKVQAKDADNQGWYGAVNVIGIIGNTEENNTHYNSGVYLGSTSGATFVSAGESGKNLPVRDELKQGNTFAYNTENLYLTADNQIEIVTTSSKNGDSDDPFTEGCIKKVIIKNGNIIPSLSIEGTPDKELGDSTNKWNKAWINTIIGNLTGDVIGTADYTKKIKTSIAIGGVNKPVYIASDGTVTDGNQYGGGTAVNLNGADKAKTTATFFAPTTSTANDSKKILVSNGAAEPVWKTVTATGSGTAIVGIKIGDDSYTATVNNVAHATNATNVDTLTKNTATNNIVKFTIGDKDYTKEITDVARAVNADVASRLKVGTSEYTITVTTDPSTATAASTLYFIY